MFSRKPPADEKLCYIDKKPCIRERCSEWEVGPVERMIDGVMTTTTLAACGQQWARIFLRGIAMRTDGTQVSIDKLHATVGERQQVTNELLAIGLQAAERHNSRAHEALPSPNVIPAERTR